jgi:hypothetical protein
MKVSSQTSTLSPLLEHPPFPIATSLGVLAWLGGTSRQGFLTKKFLGLNNTVIGSAGMTGKSSGDGKCVMPNVCQRTTSSFTRFSVGLD